MNYSYSFFKRISLASVLFLLFFVSESSAQTESISTEQNCIIARAHLNSYRGVTISYGSGKTIEIPFTLDKKLSVLEQENSKYNLIIETLNKLEKDGYKIVSTTADTYAGALNGFIYILCKNK